MIDECTKIEANRKLIYFIENKLSNYSKLRNFTSDYKNQVTTSCLSPYLTHGILSESEVIKESLKKHSYLKCQKFIDEIFWRIYWKGWLELRPQLWNDYLLELKKIKFNFKDNENYKKAIAGKSSIECFNDWVFELKEKNYLHNHVRMWFASIWIFTLNLPWQLGADFFMIHLKDGDISSNTLSWRWVAGIHTKGKNYLAKEWNIKKFTNHRYKIIKINETALPIMNNKEYPIVFNNFDNPKFLKNKKILIFENNLSFEDSDFFNKDFKKIFIVKNNVRKINLSENVISFKNKLIEDQFHRLNVKSNICEIINIDEINKINEDIYAIYPNIGENLDYVKTHNINNLKFLYREIDQYSWEHCRKGFFYFKNYIPKIIQKFC